jgi:hypothetical protein
MKKIILSLILLFPFWGLGGFVFSQSILIEPTTFKILELKKLGIGLDHRHSTNPMGVGTSINNGEAYFQTHTNHPLYFSTNNGAPQMVLYTNGNLVVGNQPAQSQKLYVDGNSLITGNIDSDGQVSVGSLTVGGGSTINKFFKVYLPEETTPSLTAKTCVAKNYSVSGVSVIDMVSVSFAGSLPSQVAVASVRPLTNVVEVKFCNNANTNIGVQTVDIKFSIIK